jgi:hypothetical protein
MTQAIKSAAPTILLIAALSVTPPALAQEICAPVVYETDNCLVGAWAGTNTVAERIREMLSAMAPAGVSRTVLPEGIDQVLGMVIYPDGFYATLPLVSGVTMKDIEEDEVITTNMRLFTGTNTGWIWTAGNSLNFCAQPGTMGFLQMDAQSSGGRASTTIDPNAAPNDYMPDITYSCGGNSMSMSIALPEPIGTVDYFLTRIPLERFDDEMRALYESRFAPEGGGE